MVKQTPLHALHVKQKALMVDFAGWEMPLQYGSTIEEHHQVRNEVGMFDVSHMLALDIQGVDATAFLRFMLANDVSKLADGQALYACMLNPQGGIIDDLIAYRINPNYYRIVVNAGMRDSDTAWLNENAKAFKVKLEPRTDLALIAIQGKHAFENLRNIIKDHTILQQKPFYFLVSNDTLYAHTGYTGEPGLEIMLPATNAADFWQSLLQMGIKPIGLAARDTLRLEAGLNLYGQDMDEQHTPYESNVGWTVDLKDSNRDFIGKAALLKQKQEGVKTKLVGVVLLESGVLRKDMLLTLGHNAMGKLTSGGFSPTLKKGIGFARIPFGEFKEAHVDIRGKTLPVQLIKPPFVKNGQANF